MARLVTYNTCAVCSYCTIIERIESAIPESGNYYSSAVGTSVIIKICSRDPYQGLSQAHGKYKTTMCRDLLLPQSCPRGASCTFAHTQDEMERYRSQKKNMKNMSEAEHSATCSMNNSPSVRLVLIL